MWWRWKVNYAASYWTTALLLASLSQLLGMDRSTPELGPGIEYVHRQIGDKPLSVFVAKIERGRGDLGWSSTLARGTVTGLSSVSKQAEAFPTERGTPLVAVNGDFFVIQSGPYQGDPLGLHIVNGELVSRPVGVSFWIDPGGKPHGNRVRAEFIVYWPDGATTRFGLNENRSENRAVVYTPTFGDSTRTTGGREFVLEYAGDGPWLPLRVGRAYSARIRAVRDSGDSALSSDTLVLSIGPRLLPNVPGAAPGQLVRISIATTPDLRDVDLAVGGGPLLLLNGKAQKRPAPNEPRHPRTALGWNETHCFLIVVDGRRPGYSIGMTLSELTDYCLRLGCTGALNLDGGGSSTFWIAGKVVNRPSDGLERRVANALVVYRKRTVEP